MKIHWSKKNKKRMVRMGTKRRRNKKRSLGS